MQLQQFIKYTLRPDPSFNELHSNTFTNTSFNEQREMRLYNTVIYYLMFICFNLPKQRIQIYQRKLALSLFLRVIWHIKTNLWTSV